MADTFDYKQALEKPLEEVQKRVEAETASRPARHYRALIFQWYVIAAVVAFATLAFLARTVAYFSFDVVITHELQAYHTAWFDALMRGVSWLGFAPQVIGVAAIFVLVLAAVGLRWEAWVTLISGTASQILNFVVKVIVHRPRPSADLVNVFQEVKGFSFPSGHVMFYTAFFGFLWFLSYTLLKHSWRRTVLLFLFMGLVLLVGPSRIYEGEHWASDVFGAYLLGSLTLLAAVAFYRWGKPRFSARQPVAPEKGAEKHPAE
ncbi:MAG TPA: phosphatase PAP2 family protein [Anaerolineales bacterium]